MSHVAALVHYRPTDAPQGPLPLPSAVLYPGPWLFPGLTGGSGGCQAALVTGLDADKASLAVFSTTGLTWHPPVLEGVVAGTWHTVEDCPDL